MIFFRHLRLSYAYFIKIQLREILYVKKRAKKRKKELEAAGNDPKQRKLVQKETSTSLNDDYTKPVLEDENNTNFQSAGKLDTDIHIYSFFFNDFDVFIFNLFRIFRIFEPK